MTPDLRLRPPEQQLLLASARVGPPDPVALRAVLEEVRDWTQVVDGALRHRLVLSLAEILEAADPTLVPAELVGALRQYRERLRELNAALVRELFVVLEECEARSVRAIPFKGPLLGQQLYGDPYRRVPGDIDLLVDRRDVQTVLSILTSRGYEDAGQGRDAGPLTPVQRQMYERFQCEYQFVRESDHMVVEPHWGLSQRPLAIDVDYAGMLARATRAVLDSRALWALAPEDLLIALCVHGAKHRWERLGWVQDVAALLAQLTPTAVERTLTRARAGGYARIVALGLWLAGAVTNNEDQAAATAAWRDRSVARLGRRVLVAAFAPEAQTPSWNDRIEMFRLNLRERWSDRVRYVVRTLLTPRRHHIETVALPAGLEWAYYPMKIGMDYAFAPLWGLLGGRRSPSGDG